MQPYQGIEPLITYITVVRNGASLIESTIKSIVQHVADDIEYLVIDGCSTDGTLEIIRKYHGKCRYISEPDLGIYDAMNKGIALAKGTYLSFINIGDHLIYPPVAELKNLADSDNRNMAVAFAVKLSDGQIFRPLFSRVIKIRNTLHHQGTYIRRINIKPYNLDFPIFADFDFNQKLFKDKGQVVLMPDIIVASHDVSGVSNHKINFQECLNVVRVNFGFRYMAASYVYFRFNGLIRRIKKGIAI